MAAMKAKEYTDVIEESRTDICELYKKLDDFNPEL